MVSGYGSGEGSARVAATTVRASATTGPANTILLATVPIHVAAAAATGDEVFSDATLIDMIEPASISTRKLPSKNDSKQQDMWCINNMIIGT